MGKHEPPGEQLALLGFDEALRQSRAGAATSRGKRRAEQVLETTQRVMMDPPTEDELAFLHSGLCQTYLPHSRPKSNRSLWRRVSGRFTLIVQPGLVDDTSPEARINRLTEEELDSMFVGLPYGARARLILIHLQSEGVKGREVALGSTLSAWIRSMGLPVQGGERGTISMIREQALRVARCQFTLQWDGVDSAGKRLRTLRDIRLVEGLELAADEDAKLFPERVLLHEDFYEHLREHAVPLDKRGVALLSGNSLGLDLYAMFAHRLPRLKVPLHLTWQQLQAQLGSDYQETFQLAARIRVTLKEVLGAYPEARVEPTRHGLMLRPSASSVPRTMVQGLRLLPGGKEA